MRVSRGEQEVKRVGGQGSQVHQWCRAVIQLYSQTTMKTGDQTPTIKLKNVPVKKGCRWQERNWWREIETDGGIGVITLQTQNSNMNNDVNHGV